jgi:hypothetical protein
MTWGVFTLQRRVGDPVMLFRTRERAHRADEYTS